MDFLLDRDWNQPVRYPDPAIEVLDLRFAPYVLGSAALNVCGPVRDGPRVQYGSVINSACFTAIFPTIELWVVCYRRFHERFSARRELRQRQHPRPTRPLGHM